MRRRSSVSWSDSPRADRQALLERPRQCSANEADVELAAPILADALQKPYKVSRSLGRLRMSSGSVSAPESMGRDGSDDVGPI
jgi:hypothetical protein